MQVFFDETIENEFAQVYRRFKKFELESDEAYQDDLDYLIKNLVVFKPLPTKCHHENFNVTAIDGSGADSLVMLNDIAIHLLTAGFAADKTCFADGTTEQLTTRPPICTHPEGLMRLIILREDKFKEVWEEFLSFIKYNYNEDLETIVLRVLRDFVYHKHALKFPSDPFPDIKSSIDLHKAAIIAGFKLYKSDIFNFSDWMVSPRAAAIQGWYEQFREVVEYSLAHSLLNSDTKFKYIFLDGSLNMLLSPGQEQPRLASNYLLRDLCKKSLNKETCIVAVSKTTTFPFVYRIAQDLEKELGGEKKWFVRIPSKHRNEPTLKLLENRPHIPPYYGVTYLFHFSSEVPILRIDLDYEWYMKNIYSTDTKIQKAKELELFQEIDWLSRDVRYFGYFFDLAFAHSSTVVSFAERDVVAEQLINYFAEQGENPKMFIHPRRRLGLM